MSDIEDEPSDPAAPNVAAEDVEKVVLSRAERRAKARALGEPFVPDAEPAKDDDVLKDLQRRNDEVTKTVEGLNATILANMTDMIAKANKATAGKKLDWFILGPFVFHRGGEIYHHNGEGDMEKWAVLPEKEAEGAREYLRSLMKRKPLEREEKT